MPDPLARACEQQREAFFPEPEDSDALQKLGCYHCGATTKKECDCDRDYEYED